MSGDDRTSAMDVFNDALEREGEKREAFLAEIGRANPSLLADVRSLLDVHEQARHSRFLGPETRGGAAAADIRGTDGGGMIGPYRILGLLGEGGMGEVYLARQEHPVRREVALKVVKLGMDTRQVIARFEAERQALALMDHPSVAKVFDAGSTDAGRPYFVMEYVRGMPITAYCDRHRLTIAARLELFTAVCEAIQHAHQKGIIHRDIKPSNVLVAVHEGSALPKVIDFGIAKVTSGQVSEQTFFTEQGQLIGTPDHVSPEQADLTGLNVDTRTDIYALGVLLYELLCGVRPFEAADLRSGGFAGMQRMIREMDPPRASVRLGAVEPAESARAAEARRSTRSALLRELRGDLDWICVKAMEKDRTRRYATASEFAADIGRYVRREAVLARPPSITYQLGRFARRNRLAVGAASIVFIVVVIWLVTLSLSYAHQRQLVARIEEQRDRALLAERSAEQEAHRADQIASLLRRMFESIHPEVARGRDVTLLLGLLEDGASMIERELADQPDTRAEMKNLVGMTYLKLGRYVEAEGHLRGALETRRELHGGDHAGVAESLHNLALVLGKLGRYEEAEKRFENAIAMRTAVFGEASLEAAESLNDLGVMFSTMKEPARAEPLLRRALEIRHRELEGDSEAVIESLATLGTALLLRGGPGDLAEAESRLTAALAGARRTLQRHPSTVAIMNQLALVHMACGDYAEAESEFREALALRRALYGDDHPLVAVSCSNLALPLRARGAYEAAIELHEESLRIVRAALGLGHPDVGQALRSYAITLRAAGRPESAGSRCREALSIVDSDSVLAAEVRYVLARCLMDQGDHEDALSELEESQLALEAHAPDSWKIARGTCAMGACLLECGRAEEAERRLKEGVDRLRAVRGTQHVETAEAIGWLTGLYESSGRHAQAEACRALLPQR